MNTRQKEKQKKRVLLTLLTLAVSHLDNELNHRRKAITYKAKELPPYYRELRVVKRLGEITLEIRAKEQNHPRPHFHVYVSGEDCASIALDNFEILAGNLSSKVRGKVLEWAKTNQGLLMNVWNEFPRNVRVQPC